MQYIGYHFLSKIIVLKTKKPISNEDWASVFLIISIMYDVKFVSFK
jgi:hypothetical protein